MILFALFPLASELFQSYESYVINTIFITFYKKTNLNQEILQIRIIDSSSINFRLLFILSEYHPPQFETSQCILIKLQSEITENEQ